MVALKFVLAITANILIVQSLAAAVPAESVAMIPRDDPVPVDGTTDVPIDDTTDVPIDDTTDVPDDETTDAPTKGSVGQGSSVSPQPGAGYPSSNPAGVTCFNTWEKVTNDPVVQYWYVVAKGAGNQIKANRVWHWLNMNGCAPTETHYRAESGIDGATLTFHTSEACTAWRVSNAIWKGSSPNVKIDCQFNGKNNGLDAWQIGKQAGDAVSIDAIKVILQALMGLRW